MAMLLKGKNGNEFEMSFVRDSFHDVQDGVGDSNWATVLFRAASDESSIEESAPCLNLFEFSLLTEWLEGVARGADDIPDVSEVELLQPELRFTLTQANEREVTIRIWFHLADRPDVYNVDPPTEEAQFLDLCVDRAHVRTAARELEDMLREIEDANRKDDISGEGPRGVLGDPQADMDALDFIAPAPPDLRPDDEDTYTERA